MSANHEPWSDLPPVVQELKRSVEIESGKTVTIQWSTYPGMHGRMTFQWICDEGVVFCKEYSHGGVAEELLHMQLDLRGYRGIDPRESLPSAEFETLELLFNVLHHAMIFPVLARMGYSHDESECEIAARQIGRERDALDREPTVPTTSSEIGLLAMYYVRAHRHCQPNEFESATQELYQQPGCVAARELGERLIEAIDLHEGSSAEHYNEVLDRCLRLLGLREKVELIENGPEDE